MTPAGHRPPGRGGADQLPHRRRARRGRPDAVHLPAADARALPLGAGHCRAAAAAARGRGPSGWRRARRCGPSSRRATSRRCRWPGRSSTRSTWPASTAQLRPQGLVYGAGHVAAGPRQLLSRPAGALRERAATSSCWSAATNWRAAWPRRWPRCRARPCCCASSRLRRWLAEKYEAWTLKRQDGAFKSALDAHGYQHDGAQALERMVEREGETLVLHELGEFEARSPPRAGLAGAARRRCRRVAPICTCVRCATIWPTAW